MGVIVSPPTQVVEWETILRNALEAQGVELVVLTEAYWLTLGL